VRYTSTQAWDEAWEVTRHVHLLGSQLPKTRACERVGRALGELSQARLPISVIPVIAEAVRWAYECGRHGSIVGSEKE
jgi:hypothetical protein